MQKRKQKDFVIPARPEVLIKLSELVDARDPSMDRISDIIKSDVSMYANTLAMINSPYFGIRGRVTSIDKAVRVMGVKRILFIAQMAALRSSLDTDGRFESFWNNAQLCAVICSHLTEYFSYLNKDDAYTLGMMHNCGIPLMHKECPGYKRFYEDNSSTSLAEQYYHEQSQFQTNHFSVSAQIAEVWNIPRSVYTAIEQQPLYEEILGNERYDDDACNLLCVLLIAREMANKFSSDSLADDGEYQPLVETDLIYEQLALTSSDINDMEFSIINKIKPE